MDIVRGVTLLDMRDLLGVSIKQVSFIFPSFSVGSMIGSFLGESTGNLLNINITYTLHMMYSN